MTLSIARPSLVDPQDPSLPRPEAGGGKPLFGEDGPSFGDLPRGVKTTKDTVSALKRALLTRDEWLRLAADGAELGHRPRLLRFGR